MSAIVSLLALAMAQLVSSPAPSQPMSELSGLVLTQDHRPLAVPASVVLARDDLPLAATEIGPAGLYAIVIPPGDYVLWVMLGSDMLSRQPIHVRPGSWIHNVETAAPPIEDRPPLITVAETKTTGG